MSTSSVISTYPQYHKVGGECYDSVGLGRLLHLYGYLSHICYIFMSNQIETSWQENILYSALTLNTVQTTLTREHLVHVFTLQSVIGWMVTKVIIPFIYFSDLLVDCIFGPALWVLCRCVFRPALGWLVIHCYILLRYDENVITILWLHFDLLFLEKFKQSLTLL